MLREDRSGGASRTRARAVTIREVAQHAGVSMMTVSRVINGSSRVSDRTRQKVEAAIAELRFVPNSAARNLAGLSKVRVGVPHCFPSAAYLGDFLVGCLDQAGVAPIQFLIEKCPSPMAIDAVLARMMEDGVDGVILPPPLCNVEATLQWLSDSGIPVVAVATGGPTASAPSVSIDDQAASQAMTSHILALGHRRIGFIKGDEHHPSTIRRLRGYERALEEAGLELEPALIVDGHYTYRSGLDAMEQLLALEQRPTAVFASNDDMAAAAVSVAHQAGLAVPGDITICGFDDTSIASTIWPQLTTIHQPVKEMASTAIELLMRLIEQGGEVAPVELPFSLVRRQSDAAPRRRPAAVR